MADRPMFMLAGIPIVASRWMDDGHERGYPDWRQRLARNLGRRSDGAWEPLTYSPPNVFLIDGTLYGHPRVVAAMCLNISPTPDPEAP